MTFSLSLPRLTAIYCTSDPNTPGETIQGPTHGSRTLSRDTQTVVATPKSDSFHLDNNMRSAQQTHTQPRRVIFREDLNVIHQRVDTTTTDTGDDQAPLGATETHHNQSSKAKFQPRPTECTPSSTPIVEAHTRRNTLINSKVNTTKIKLNEKQACNLAKSVVAELMADKEIGTTIRTLQDLGHSTEVNRAEACLVNQLSDQLTQKIIIGFISKNASNETREATKHGAITQYRANLVAHHRPSFHALLKAGQSTEGDTLTPSQRAYMEAMEKSYDELAFFGV